MFRNETRFWCTSYIKVDGEDGISEITSTPGHKYYLPFNTESRNPNELFEHASYSELSEKWVSAEDLKSGDKVLLSNGKYGIIVKIEIKKLDEPETTYNFEVEDLHTYYVGEQGTLVHNMAGLDCGGNYLHDGNEVYRGGNFEADMVKGHYKVDA